MMNYEQLKKAYEALELLQTLDLPTDEQLKNIADLEKQYLQESVIPLIKKELEPFFSSLVNKSIMRIVFSPEEGLNISLDGEKSVHSPNPSPIAAPMERGRRVNYSIDGGTPLNKRRFVWEVVRKYVETHPEITFEELERVFPSSLSRSSTNGVVRIYESVVNRCKTNPDLQKRYFLEQKDLITLSDGTKVAVYNQWGNEFDRFLPVAQQLFNVECVE